MENNLNKIISVGDISKMFGMIIQGDDKWKTLIENSVSKTRIQLEYVIMIGSTLSGKSTYCKENLPNHERISLEQLHSKRNLELNLIEEHLKSGKNLVVDDTNLTRKIRKTHIDLAKRYQCKS